MLTSLQILAPTIFVVVLVAINALPRQSGLSGNSWRMLHDKGLVVDWFVTEIILRKTIHCARKQTATLLRIH